MTLWTFSSELVPLVSLMLPVTSQPVNVIELSPSITSASELLAVSVAFDTVISAVEYTAGEL